MDDNIIVLVIGKAKGFDGWFESLSKVQHSPHVYYKRFNGFGTCQVGDYKKIL